LQCAEKIELLQRVAVCNNNSSREKKKLFQWKEIMQNVKGKKMAFAF
jgi:hypothetical protein